MVRSLQIWWVFIGLWICGVGTFGEWRAAESAVMQGTHHVEEDFKDVCTSYISSSIRIQFKETKWSAFLPWATHFLIQYYRVDGMLWCEIRQGRRVSTMFVFRVHLTTQPSVVLMANRMFVQRRLKTSWCWYALETRDEIMFASTRRWYEETTHFHFKWCEINHHDEVGWRIPFEKKRERTSKM